MFDSPCTSTPRDIVRFWEELAGLSGLSGLCGSMVHEWGFSYGEICHREM